MTHENKYADIDKAITLQVMEEVKGYSIPIVCPMCNGEKETSSGSPCTPCDGVGSYNIQY